MLFLALQKREGIEMTPNRTIIKHFLFSGITDDNMWLIITSEVLV